MRGTYLGEFEELVLLAVGILFDDAYGLAIVDELEKQTGRNIMISSVHKALVRLEDKGYLKSHRGGATEVRGGRDKRLVHAHTSWEKSIERIPGAAKFHVEGNSKNRVGGRQIMKTQLTKNAAGMGDTFFHLVLQ